MRIPTFAFVIPIICPISSYAVPSSQSIISAFSSGSRRSISLYISLSCSKRSGDSSMSVICSDKLPAGTVGAIVGQGAIATVNRYNAPGIAGAYPITYRATDQNGLTIGFRYGTDLAKGYNYLAADMLMGAKVLIPNKVVRLVES